MYFTRSHDKSCDQYVQSSDHLGEGVVISATSSTLKYGLPPITTIPEDDRGVTQHNLRGVCILCTRVQLLNSSSGK